MIYNNKQYDKISERVIGGNKVVFYRLGFTDIKQVEGDIYLVEREGVFTEMASIKDELKRVN